jgi:hypothetical protein
MCDARWELKAVILVSSNREREGSDVRSEVRRKYNGAQRGVNKLALDLHLPMRIVWCSVLGGRSLSRDNLSLIRVRLASLSNYPLGLQ